MRIKIILTLLVVLTGFACTPAQQQKEQQEQKQMMKREKPIAIGEVASDFTLEDQNKNKITLSASKDKEIVVLVFYRGSW